MRCKFNSPVRRKQAEGDYVYGLNDPGKLECIDLKTGKSVWKDDRATRTRVRRSGRARFCSQDDLIVALDRVSANWSSSKQRRPRSTSGPDQRVDERPEDLEHAGDGPRPRLCAQRGRDGVLRFDGEMSHEQ